MQAPVACARTGGLGCGGSGGGGSGGDVGGGGGSTTTVTFANADTSSTFAVPATRNTSVCVDVTTLLVASQLAPSDAAVTMVDCSDTRQADDGVPGSSHAHAQMALPAHPLASTFCAKSGGGQKRSPRVVGHCRLVGVCSAL